MGAYQEVRSNKDHESQTFFLFCIATPLFFYILTKARGSCLRYIQSDASVNDYSKVIIRSIRAMQNNDTSSQVCSVIEESIVKPIQLRHTVYNRQLPFLQFKDLASFNEHHREEIGKVNRKFGLNP
jgi:hypothetical protein